MQFDRIWDQQLLNKELNLVRRVNLRKIQVNRLSTRENMPKAEAEIVIVMVIMILMQRLVSSKDKYQESLYNLNKDHGNPLQAKWERAF